MELMIPEYDGPIGATPGVMTGHARAAYQIYHQQVSRCSNPKNPSFKTYGAVGIRVRYSVRKFITWYLNHRRHFKGSRPVVGRIDHSKDYCFENIELISAESNGRERTNRLGPVTPRRPVLAFRNDGSLHGWFESVREAAQATGLQHGAVVFSCKNMTKRGRSGFYFRYE